jgi:hypothetical protein
VAVGALRCYVAALRHNLSPWEYYAYELWRPEAVEEIDAFVYESEKPGLMMALNRRPSPDPVNDKLAFHDFCTRADLPAPTLVAYWEKGAPVRDPGEDFPPEGVELWIKPRRGAGSERQEPWSPRRSDRTALLERLAKLSRETPLLVQEKLLNHPEVDPATNGALAVARILTARRRDGSIELLHAVAFLPHGDQVATQGWGSLTASIDPANGRLGDGFKLWPVRRRFERHPDTDAPIGGRTLPGWARALSCVDAAHAAIDGFVFLGWDVAFTPGGPVLLEANEGWTCFPHQAISESPCPLGRTALKGVVREHLGG